MKGESGTPKSGDQPRMTERQLNTGNKDMGRISYTRQAQRGGMPQRSSNRSYGNR